MRVRWLMTGVVALGLTGAPLFVRAAEQEKNIRYAELPKSVRETVDRERGKHEVKEITHVVRDGRDWYRVTIDTKGPDSVLRVADGGKILSEQETADVAPVKERPAAVRAVESEEGKPVNFDDLPGGVKTTIGREQRNRKMVRVTTYEHRNTTIYRAVVTDGNREEVIRVLPDGKLYVEVDDTTGGKKEVAMDSLPVRPKTAFGSELGADKPGKIWQITRDGKTYYQAEIVGRNGTRVVQITDEGKIIPVDSGTEAPTSKRKGK